MDVNLMDKPLFLRKDSCWCFGERLVVGNGCLDEYIKGKKERLANVDWLTVANCKLEVEGLAACCKIQLTAKARMDAAGCMFKAKDLSKTECAVEVFANSMATFQDCFFVDCERVAVMARNYAYVVFRNCVFANNTISAFIMDGAICTFDGCRFVGGENAEVFVTKGSQARFSGCTFEGGGRGILAKDRCVVVVENSEFWNMEKAAIHARGCDVDLYKVCISKTKSTGVVLAERSRAKCQDIEIYKVDGNCLNINNSGGTFRRCLFSKSKYPAIATIGRTCNPVFVECLVSECKTFLVVARELAVPTFVDCIFDSCKSHAMSITTLSHPVVDGCLFKNIDRADMFLSVYAGVKVKRDETRFIMLEDGCVVGDGVYVEEEEEEEEVEVRSWRSPSYDVYEDVERLAMEEEEGSKLLDVREKVKAIRNEEVEYVCIPCGHCCRGGEEGECDVCGCDVEKREKVRRSEVCAICLDNDACAICMPCGHEAMCATCAMKCVEKGFNCPVCNVCISNLTFT